MKKVLSIVLASFMLFSSMGFHMATHYCGGEAVMAKIVLGQKHVDCGMGELEKSCNSESKVPIIQKTPCCQNQYVSFVTENEFQLTIKQIDIHAFFIIALSYVLLDLRFPNTNEQFAFKTYSPPPLAKDVRVLFQSFLI